MIDLLDPSSLRAAREAAGLSRGQLAARSKVHETTIGRIENGTVDPRLTSTWGPLVRVLKSVRHSDADSPADLPRASGKCDDLATPRPGAAA